jgi:ABC-type iron transport system FetAB ATPase subunit
MTAQDAMALKVKVSQLFTPGAPINHQQLFSGRTDQINDVLNAALQTGRHAVLFGERGVGKTSLARVISSVVAKSGYKQIDCGTINCDSSDDFSTLWRKIFREVSIAISVQQPGFQGAGVQTNIALDFVLPDRELTPDDVRYALTRLGIPSIIVIDELDRLTRIQARHLLADTIKNLSDHAVPTTLVLVGVADSVDDLIAEHESIARALVQVPMPRMSQAELIEILDKGFGGAGIVADDGSKSWIARLSQGLPHYTHSLGLYSAFHAIEDGRTTVGVDDVLVATQAAVEKSHTIRTAYNKATSSPQKQNLYARVLRACALADTDELGYFAAADLKGPLSAIMGRPYEVPNYSRHLHDFCEDKHGAILRKRGEPRRVRFRFADPMMQPFVIIHDYSIGALTNELLQESRGRTRRVTDHAV